MSSPHTKKFIRLSVTLGLLLIGGFVIFRSINPSIGFTYYEPAYLPPNVSIKAKRISMSNGHASVQQNFRTENWIYDIDEREAHDSSSIGSANQNYDAKSVRPTCDVRDSPAHMQYRVCHWIDYGRIDVHEVRFIKDGTFIRSHIPTTTNQQISIQEIGKYVDSFTPKSTIGFPVLRFNGA